jgi:hypothetical protein
VKVGEVTLDLIARTKDGSIEEIVGEVTIPIEADCESEK